jgi:putative transposase
MMIMPRTARIKNDAAIYHTMVRSISEVSLFRNDSDRDKYLQLIKKYQQIYLFKIYSYCLMTSHAHMSIDCCGADISKIMKSINQSYSTYYNKKHDRHGHLFQDRFKSKIIDNRNYLLTSSAYIHRNPKDIAAYSNKIQEYKYSSLGIYFGIASDVFKILDTDYILGHFSNDEAVGRKAYLDFMNRISDTDEKMDINFKNDGSKCISGRKVLIRDFEPKKIIEFISKYTDIDFNIHIKFTRKHTELKALCVLVMRSLCDMTLFKLCDIIGNITSSSLWRLCEKGYYLITKDERYLTLIDDLIAEFKAV